LWSRARYLGIYGTDSRVQQLPARSKIGCFSKQCIMILGLSASEAKVSNSALRGKLLRTCAYKKVNANM